MRGAGHPKPALWDNPEGWGGEGGGGGDQDRGTDVHLWLIHVNVQRKPPQYCKETGLCFQQHFRLYPLPLVLTAEPAARFLPEALKLPQ